MFTPSARLAAIRATYTSSPPASLTTLSPHMEAWKRTQIEKRKSMAALLAESGINYPERHQRPAMNSLSVRADHGSWGVW